MKKPYTDIHKLPLGFTLTVDQVATLSNCHRDTVIKNIHRDPDDKYYLKAFRNTEDSPYVINAWDYEDFAKRRVIGTDYRGEDKLQLSA